MSGGELADELLRARAYLSRVAEPASVVVWAWVRRVGPVEAAAAIRAAQAPEAVVSATQARRDRVDVDADLDAAARHGIRLVVPEGDDWPHFALAGMEAAAAERWRAWQAGDRAPRQSGESVPPLALWVRGPGSLRDAAVRSVGVVGARAATEYGVHVASELGYGLAAREVTVVSGGAFGIDAAAHRGALAAQGTTVLVSAGGLDRPYPAGNGALFERIGESGVLASESPPGAAPQRRRFLSRNRLIAALSTGTVVVEAGRRSGSLNTAAHARRLGRAVMAVPGPVTSAASVGCHDLLRGVRVGDRAEVRLVTGVEDVLAEIGAPGEGLAPLGKRTSAVRRRWRRHQRWPAAPQASGIRCRIRSNRAAIPCAGGSTGSTPRRPPRWMRCGSAGWLQEDELSVVSALPIPQVRRALAALLLYGLAESGPDGYRLHPRVRR